MNDGITFLGETTSLRENNEVWFANSKNQDWFEKQNCNPQQTLASYSSAYRYSTRQVYNLFQESVEQPPLGFSIAEEKIRQF